MLLCEIVNMLKVFHKNDDIQNLSVTQLSK